MRIFQMGNWDGRVIAVQQSQMWQEKLTLHFGCWVLSSAGWQDIWEIMQMRFRRHFQMTDRLPNWQLACVGFSLVRTVWLSGDKWNGYTLLVLRRLITSLYLSLSLSPSVFAPPHTHTHSHSPSFSLSPSLQSSTSLFLSLCTLLFSPLHKQLKRIQIKFTFRKQPVTVM